MAEAVLFNIADGIISKLGSLVLKEIGIWWGVKDELAKLNGSVSTIKAVLLHAEEQSLENPQVKNWVAMLSDAIYDADDLVDEVSTQALRQQLAGGSRMGKKVSRFLSSSSNFTSGLKLGHKIKALRERLDEIAANRKFHLEERSESVGRFFAAKGRDQTHSSPPEVVIGREHEKDAIVDVLLSSDDGENVAVVPIVGIGGLGKTTLAQLVYNDDKIQKHFELKMWVCVSDPFDVQLIVEKILESASRQRPENAGMDPLKTLLHEAINGRRYLLVLDDVWNEDLNKWFNLKDLLAGGARGSKIIITTRLRKVAEMSRPIFVHELGGLPETEAWSLFKQMAFKQGQVPNPGREAAGKEIAAKCYGVPLVIKTIGGMLYYKDSESEWLLFKNTELTKVEEYKNDILSFLKLSYNHLPSRYKHCFAICSLYPKDHMFEIHELVHLWMGLGYLKSMDPGESCEDVGYRYFMDLFRLSFFQDVKKDMFGNFFTCKMHDLMHDLAISVSGSNFSFFDSKMPSMDYQIRHVSFVIGRDSAVRDFSFLLKAKKTRTLLARSVKVQIKEEEIHSLFCNLRCLRVLDLSLMGINNLPSSINRLIHLRHLDISDNDEIKNLPDSINDLLNLQVLKLTCCIQLRELPKNITKLVNLGHFDNDYCDGLTHMPLGIGQLTRLERLSTFVYPKDKSISKNSAGLAELHGLNNLRDTLKIKNLKYVKNVKSEFQAARLSAKHKLTRLELCWNEYEDDNGVCSIEDVANDEMGLEALQPPQGLKALKVSFYRGVRPPSWLPSLTHLVSISVENCKSIQWLPSFDHLPFLTRLWLFELTNLEYIDIAVTFRNRESSSFFPSLTDLLIVKCPNLKGFVRCKSEVGTEELPSFPCLSRLDIGGCSKLCHMPNFPTVKWLTLRKGGLESLKEMLKNTSPRSQSTSSPFFVLSQLENLNLWEMEDFPDDELLQYLTSLQHLEFHECKFKSVASDDKDGGVQWQSLKVLTSVQFADMEYLVSIPKGLQYVTTLQSLYIRRCCNLMTIPEWMTYLTSLQHLDIIDCPHLSGRCKNNLAEDWLKISHIPHISIDSRSVQRNGCYLL